MSQPHWIRYDHANAVVGRRVRVAGRNGQHNQIENVFDLKICNIPAGLIGLCTTVLPNSYKITFHKHEGDNHRLWGAITNLSAENKDADSLVGYMAISRMRGMEIEADEIKMPRTHIGTAMGVRG